jgi:hypothetical protein
MGNKSLEGLMITKPWSFFFKFFGTGVNIHIKKEKRGKNIFSDEIIVKSIP